MAPLSVPVNIPPSNKLEPIRIDPQGVDVPLISADSYETRASNIDWVFFRGFAYANEVSAKLYVAFPADFRIFEGFTDNQIGDIDADLDGTETSGRNHIAYLSGEVFTLQGRIVRVYDPVSGNNVRNLDYSSVIGSDVSDAITSISTWKGNLIICNTSGVFHVSKESVELIDSVSKNDLQNYLPPAAALMVNDNLVVVEEPATDEFTLGVYKGFSSERVGGTSIESLLNSFSVNAAFRTEVARNVGGVEKVRLYMETGGAGVVTVIDLDFDLDASVFEGTIENDLETGDVYYFFLPYATKQTSFSIDLNATEYPVNTRTVSGSPARSIQGVTPMYFDGSSFTVISLTEALAAQVYGFIPSNSIGTTEGDVAALEAGGVFADARISQSSVTQHAEAIPGTSTNQSALGFDAWRTPNANRPVTVFLDVHVETDGTTAGEVRLDIDESGGTTPDFDRRALVGIEGGAGAAIDEPISQTIPPGASYKVTNTADPNVANTIRLLREQVR